MSAHAIELERDEEAGVSTVDLPIPKNSNYTRLSVPETATDEEAAALAACIGAHLCDEQVSASGTMEPETADRWSLSGRYGCRRRSALPRSVECGEEWKMAGRGWSR